MVDNEIYQKIKIYIKLGTCQTILTDVMWNDGRSYEFLSIEDEDKLKKAYNDILEVRQKYAVNIKPEQVEV